MNCVINPTTATKINKHDFDKQRNVAQLIPLCALLDYINTDEILYKYVYLFD